MKNRLYLISILAICTVPFVAPWEGASSAMGSQAIGGISIDQAAAGNLATASFMPVLDVDMSDLDVRDSQNRPVSGTSARQDLTALFMENLFNLTIVANQHAIREIWNDLALLSNLFHNTILNIFYPLKMAIPEAFGRSTKRFVHNVHNLWITLALGMLLGSLLSATILVRSCQQFVVLRC